MTNTKKVLDDDILYISRKYQYIYSDWQNEYLVLQFMDFSRIYEKNNAFVAFLLSLHFGHFLNFKHFCCILGTF